jgi:hypothetical protein
MTETIPTPVADDTLQSCGTCRNFKLEGTNAQCRLAPPQPMVVGVVQAPVPGALVRPGGPQVATSPVVQGFFSPTLAHNWCAQWRYKDFESERPPLPKAPAQPGTRYRT